MSKWNLTAEEKQHLLVGIDVWVRVLNSCQFGCGCVGVWVFVTSGVGVRVWVLGVGVSVCMVMGMVSGCGYG